jgi:hypothetical protein
MAVTSQIVNITATVATPPAPSLLQQSGALVSVGGTTLATNAYQYCANAAAVTAILSAAGNYTELSHMATTYFAQGTAVGVWVLEIGTQGGVVATQISALNTWIQGNPNQFYAYLCPAAWDASGATVQSGLAANYSSATGRTYFFVTTSQATITAYTSKSVFAVVPSPTAAATEFQAAAFFYQWLVNNPSLAAPAAPMAYRFAFGVTPWVINATNTTSINAILTAFGNVILTGAEGGISTSTLFKCTFMDGNQAMFWYAVDYVQIQAKQQLAAAIINGSNTNNPVYYNQFGINYLLGILDNLGNAAIGFGLLLSASFTATPFTTFTNANPTDYAAGVYNGFAATVTPQVGFLSITFNLSAVTFT